MSDPRVEGAGPDTDLSPAGVAQAGRAAGLSAEDIVNAPVEDQTGEDDDDVDNVDSDDVSYDPLHSVTVDDPDDDGLGDDDDDEPNPEAEGNDESRRR